MTFLALHASRQTSLATDRLWLTADDVSACQDARALLQRLEQLLASREAELAAARDRALAEGRAEGRREALAQEAARLWDAWDAAARSARADVDTLRKALVALSLQVVQRIAGELGPPAVMAAVAAQAARDLLPDSAAVVRVHPDVAAAVRERIGALPGVLEVRADATLGRCDCALDTAAGQRLAGLPMQLERLAAAWREGLEAGA
jgi:type III secretion protein L